MFVTYPTKKEQGKKMTRREDRFIKGCVCEWYEYLEYSKNVRCKEEEEEQQENEKLEEAEMTSWKSINKKEEKSGFRKKRNVVEMERKILSILNSFPWHF